MIRTSKAIKAYGALTDDEKAVFQSIIKEQS